MSVTKDEVADKVKVNNVQLIASFKELLKDTAGQIKRANDTSAELPTKETKKLKFREPLQFQKNSASNSTNSILNLRRPSAAPSPLPRRPTSRSEVRSRGM